MSFCVSSARDHRVSAAIRKARSHVVLLTRLTLSLSPDSLRATMKKFVALLLCLSLSIFTVARAMKPGHALAGVAKIDQKKPTGQKAGAKTLLNDANKALAAMIKADDDSMEDASDDEGEDVSDDDGGGADSGDGGGDDGGDNRGGDEGD